MTIEELQTEIEDLKNQIKEISDKSISVQSNPSGTLAALSTLLLNPVTPQTISWDSPPGLQYPASFKLVCEDGGGGIAALNLYYKSQYSPNQDWEKCTTLAGVSGQQSYFKTAFYQNNANLKFFPSGVGQGDVGSNINPENVTGNIPEGLVISGIDGTLGAHIPNAISLDGYVETFGNAIRLWSPTINGGYLDIIPPDSSQTGSPMINTSATNLKLPPVSTSSINLTDASKLTLGSGFQNYTPVLGGSGSMTASLIAGTSICQYYRIGNVCMVNGGFGVTTGGTPSNYITATLPINSSQSTSFMYTYYGVRGSGGGIPALGGVQNSTQVIVFFAGGSDNINWANGDHNVFFVTWFPC